MKKNERVKALISLDAIKHNFESMKNNISPDTKIVAVIKADGYGHGAVPIAHLVENFDYIWGFATATAEEAIELRENHITKPIMILGLVFEEYFPEMVSYDIEPAVCTWEMAKGLSEEALRQQKEIKIQLALDTGMTRIGFADNEQSIEEIKKIQALPNLKIAGIFTHFARADEYDISPAASQLKRYLAFAKKLESEGISVPMKHCSNSAGIIRMKEANLNAVRAGITIYGIYPSNEVERDIIELIPAMEIKSHITYVKTIQKGASISYGGTFTAPKTMRVATIPVGYADGYPRQLSNKGWVLIHGKKAPILGRVCMDQFMVDVTDIEDVKRGTEATLLGADGKEFISIEEFGDMSGRFSYEFACDITKRVPRVYVKDGLEIE